MIPTVGSAAVVKYAFAPVGGTLSYDPSVAEAISGSFIRPGYGGTFTFDTATNSLLGFEYGFPLSLNWGAGPDDFPKDAVINLFGSAGPCDLQCFTDAINASSYSIEFVQTTVRLNFGGALNGTVTGTGGFGVGRPISATGNFHVTGSVPEPSTWGLLLFGFTAIGVGMRRSRKANFRTLLSAD
ncbi:PEP-CTERM sorting domain-containing protein [Sphingomonas piscis]|uniref:PEP-CTERM sorting domain-containing protein n=1 Tax=Sphingomonas piscis TaxID=2714943 RepID=A0A6G7YPH7_9SPHN|nr:PEP-CTERM sorting domain-containing protein [Sphingomonas piscis]QIK78645.1 PEP-CTERM sorting domain-containing protein [Sphingomonas piscis]